MFDLLMLFGNNDYYSEFIFDFIVEEFVDDDFEFDDDFWVFPRLDSKTVDELIVVTEAYLEQLPNKR